MAIRPPERMRAARLPETRPPPTVARDASRRQPEPLSLDMAIRVALQNSEVVRVLQGPAVGSSGRTIYDPAISNTQIDRARSRFDPSIRQQNTFERLEDPQGTLDPFDPTRARIGGDAVDQYTMGVGVEKDTIVGGTAAMRVDAHPRDVGGSLQPLNPQSRTGVEFSYTQPLLQGGGRAANLAPVVLARIDTESSFYELKDSVQQLVRGTIEGYWAVVFARTNVWARQQQVRQAQGAYDLARARFDKGFGNAGDAAQARAALGSFRASLITAEADLLTREAALRNVLGLPPADGSRLVPYTRPAEAWVEADWEDILLTAGQYRPDLIQRKLRIEADEQELIAARNQAMPRVDATALYRFNGLAGRDPSRQWLATDAGEYTSWRLGVDLTVPFGLRDGRAEMRRRELALMRDRANLQQALHAASHELAESYRNLAQFYEQYRAFKIAREAAYENLRVQSGRFAADVEADYLNLLQAIASWGDAVSSEAQALLQYNTELANLAQLSGTILEGHGVRFTEDGYRSVGPAGRLGPTPCYPMDRRPCPNTDQYPAGTEPAEEVFELESIPIPRRTPLEALPPGPKMPGPPVIEPPVPEGPNPLRRPGD